MFGNSITGFIVSAIAAEPLNCPMLQILFDVQIFNGIP